MEILTGVLDDIASALSEDGFERRSSVVFAKPTVGPWRAWIGITGDSYTLDPMVGVLSEELIDIRIAPLN